MPFYSDNNDETSGWAETARRQGTRRRRLRPIKTEQQSLILVIICLVFVLYPHLDLSFACSQQKRFEVSLHARNLLPICAAVWLVTLKSQFIGILF